MLELRPLCENCRKPLPPDADDAMICSFECTFCANCVVEILDNVCPNCGGGFTPRPIRPRSNWKDNNCLDYYPASETIRYRPVDPASHTRFAAAIKKIPPGQR